MEKVTITATMGRNIGSEAMPANRWQIARYTLQDGITGLGGDIIFNATGQGLWAGEVTEEACAIIAFIEVRKLPQLRMMMRDIARHYEQEALGLIVHDGGTDSLVWAQSHSERAA